MAYALSSEKMSAAREPSSGLDLAETMDPKLRLSSRQDECPIEVFVHLAHDKDARAWRAARDAGRLIGINDETPYGYGRAERMGCRVTFSRSEPEGTLACLLRLGVRAVLGFDLVHALAQREALLRAQIVWTHTESQYLAVAALLAARVGRKNAPKLLGQSVWLFDRWPSLPFFQKRFFRWLIERVDILTVHSCANRAVAQKLFPGKTVELVPFGIPSEEMTPPVVRPGRPIRVLAPGSDRHRDWKTLVHAVEGIDDARLTILSGSAPKRLARRRPRVTIGRAGSQAELVAHLAEATIVCVPLTPNLHASGLTVVQEAVLAGVPVVATDTGGLSGYFDHDAILFVPPGNAAALRAAIVGLADHPQAAKAMADRAQSQMASGVPGAEAYVRQHVAISRSLLGRGDDP